MRHRSWIRIPQILTGPFSPQFFSLFPEIRRLQRSVLNVPFRQIGRLTRPISKKNRKRGFGTHNHWNCGPILTWGRGIMYSQSESLRRMCFKFQVQVFPCFATVAKHSKDRFPLQQKIPKKTAGETPSKGKKTRKDPGQRDPPWRAMY